LDRYKLFLDFRSREGYICWRLKTTSTNCN
jgi:hypothetical protein